MNICFLSSNQYKINEVKSILESEKIKVIEVNEKIEEIQSDDISKIAIDKVLKAHSIISRPIFVEQTGLLIKGFGNLPGGLTQVFWDSLQADKFSSIFSKIEKAEVVARTVIAYSDGKHIITFDGEINGHIVEQPRGNRDFQWDCVFEPEGYDKTFAELGDKKNEISMRKKALEKFKKYLEEQDAE